MITLLSSLSLSLRYYVVTVITYSSPVRLKTTEVVTVLTDVQGHCIVFTTGQHTQYTSNYPPIPQHSVSWTPEGLLLHSNPLPFAFISKAIKYIFIFALFNLLGQLTMQVKRLQCLRENQLMPFISLHFPQQQLFRITHG